MSTSKWPPVTEEKFHLRLCERLGPANYARALARFHNLPDNGYRLILLRTLLAAVRKARVDETLKSFDEEDKYYRRFDYRSDEFRLSS
jgi:hypothetical protein